MDENILRIIAGEQFQIDKNTKFIKVDNVAIWKIRIPGKPSRAAVTAFMADVVREFSYDTEDIILTHRFVVNDRILRIGHGPRSNVVIWREE